MRKITDIHSKHLSEAHIGIKRTPESLIKFKKSIKKRWTDPEFRKKMHDSRMNHFISEETKKKISKAHITITQKQEEQIIKLYEKLTATEISSKLNLGESIIYSCLKRNKIERRSVGLRNGNIPWNKNINYSKKQCANLNLEGLGLGRGWNKGLDKSDFRVKKQAEKLKGKHHSIKTEFKYGNKHPNWMGGTSFEPYGVEFNNKLKSKIRVRDNNRCQMPGCGIYENGRTHNCHHIDYDKTNNIPENLITLCGSCHSKTNFNRDYWTIYFQKIMGNRENLF